MTDKQTNLVIVSGDTEVETKKFVVWNIEGENPVEVLQNLEITRIAFEDAKKLFEHPLEDGSKIIDFSITEQKKATMQAYIAVDDEETLTELNQIYINGTLLRIRAENKIVENVVISSQPFELTGDIIDKTAYSISFQEAQFINPQYVSMPNAKKKTNISRVNSGIKKAEKTETKKSSWLNSLIFGGRT